MSSKTNIGKFWDRTVRSKLKDINTVRSSFCRSMILKLTICPTLFEVQEQQKVGVTTRLSSYGHRRLQKLGNYKSTMFLSSRVT